MTRPKKVILCVDDDKNALSVLTFMLETRRYRVLAVTTAAEAIAAFSNTWVDLVLCDFAMPHMNGIQIITRLKEIAGFVPMVLLGEPHLFREVTHSADALLSKAHCRPEELLERIKVMSARKRGPRPKSVPVASIGN